MLAVWQSLREQILILDRQLLTRAKAEPAAQRLMSIPAVGVIIADQFRRPPERLCIVKMQAGFEKWLRCVSAMTCAPPRQVLR